MKIAPIKLTRQTITTVLALLLSLGLAFAYTSEASKTKDLEQRLSAAEGISAGSAPKIAALTAENADLNEKFKAAEVLFSEKEQEISDLKAALESATKGKRPSR